MSRYTPEKLVAISRYRYYFPTLPEDVQTDIYARMAELIVEEKAYCDQGNTRHMAQILTSIAMYEVLQKHGWSEEKAYMAISEEMWKSLDPSIMAIFHIPISYAPKRCARAEGCAISALCGIKRTRAKAGNEIKAFKEVRQHGTVQGFCEPNEET